MAISQRETTSWTGQDKKALKDVYIDRNDLNAWAVDKPPAGGVKGQAAPAPEMTSPPEVVVKRRPGRPRKVKV